MHRSLYLTSLLALAFSFSCNRPANNSVTNDSIATEIKAKMFSEQLLKSSNLNVSVKDGTVTLSGQLSNDAARLAAERIASATIGVSKVVDQTVVPIKPAMAEYIPPAAPRLSMYPNLRIPFAPLSLKPQRLHLLRPSLQVPPRKKHRPWKLRLAPPRSQPRHRLRLLRFLHLLHLLYLLQFSPSP